MLAGSPVESALHLLRKKGINSFTRNQTVFSERYRSDLPEVVKRHFYIVEQVIINDSCFLAKFVNS